MRWVRIEAIRSIRTRGLSRGGGGGEEEDEREFGFGTREDDEMGK